MLGAVERPVALNTGRPRHPAWRLADKAIAEHDDLDRRYNAAIKTFKPIRPPTTQSTSWCAASTAPRPDNIDAGGRSRHGDKLAEPPQVRLLRERAGDQLTALAICAALVSLVAGTFTILAITRRLQRATEVAREVAAGNLTANIEVGRNDELGQLLGSLREMNDSLTGIVGRVRQAAELVTSASGEIAMGNADLSSRTEEQASSFEETASLHRRDDRHGEPERAERQPGERCRIAADASPASECAVDEVVEDHGRHPGLVAQDRRHHRRDRLDRVPDQHLALNAAVEAARRSRAAASRSWRAKCSLAQPRQAAKGDQGPHHRPVDRVDAGARLADDAGKTMTGSGREREPRLDIIGEIASATSEQSTGIA